MPEIKEPLISTYSVPMQPFEETTDVAEELLTIISGQGTRKQTARYKVLRNAMRTLSKPSSTKKYKYPSRAWEHVIPFLTLTPAIKEFYGQLSTKDTAMLLEVLGWTQNTDVVSRHGVDKTLRDILLSSKISDALKFAIAVNTYKKRSVALWITLTDGGQLIPLLLKTLEETFQRTVAQIGTSDDIVATLLYESMITGRNESDPKGARVVANIHEEILTSGVLALLLEKYSHDANARLEPVSALANHARRLLSLDSSVPDDWALKAFH